MAIAILTTGGTIESESNEYMREKITDESYIHKYVEDSDNIDAFKLMNKLSENMIPKDWIHIAKKIKNKIREGYENIIVTHGTDTMIYTATAVNILLKNISKKIIFTGAMKGPDDENSDAYVNLISAIKACEDNNLNSGVYISLRSNESIKKIYLHKPLYIKPLYMDSFGYKSLFNNYVGVYESNSWKWNNIKDYELKNIKNPISRTFPSQKEITEASNNIAFIQSYPGLQLKNIEEDNIIISTYHSGTSVSIFYENSLRNFIKENPDKNILLVGFSSSNIENIYESSYELQKDGAVLVEDIQPHVLYVSLSIGLSVNMNVTEILNKFQS